MSGRAKGGGLMRRLVLDIGGWVLLLGGLAALVLPGPGLLMIFAGLALLSQRYEWAARRLEPVRLRALRGAAEGVETIPRVIGSSLGGLALTAVGVLWTVQPAAPSWWPVAGTWWLYGGWGVGISLLASGLLALAMIGYSYRRFHGRPETVEALDRDIHAADEADEAANV